MGDSSYERGHQIDDIDFKVFSEDTAKHGDNQKNAAGHVAFPFEFDSIQQDEQCCPNP